MTETPKLTAQQKVVADYLKAGKTLTNKVALTCLGVGSLSSRIAELRRLGFKITDSRADDPLTGRWYTKYNIEAGENNDG